MKLVILTPYWKSKHGGGITTYLHGFVNTLNNISNIEFTIGYINGRDKNYYKISKGLISSFFRTTFILKKIKPDIIHVHEHYPLLFGGAIYKIFNKKVKLIYTPLTEPLKPKNLIKKIIFLPAIF